MQCRTEHMSLRADKCKLLWPHAGREVPARLAVLCRERGVSIVTGGIGVLGGLITGASAEGDTALGAWLDRQMDKHTPFFTAIAHGAMPASTAYRLIRVCGLPRTNYTSRVCRPANTTAPALMRWDQQIVASVREKCGIGSDEIASDERPRQFALPLDAGGLGLRPVSGLYHAIAFLSSVLQTVPDLSDVERERVATHDVVSGVWRAARTCHAQILNGGFRGVIQFPQIWTLLIEAYRVGGLRPDGTGYTQLQRALTAFLESMMVAENDHLSVAMRARLLSASAPRASVWLSMRQETQDLFLDDIHFAQAMRLRLGLGPAVAAALPVRCVCGLQLRGNADAPSDHFHVCPILRRASANARHDRVVQALAREGRRAGMTVTVEPRMYGVGRVRPDIRFVGSRGELLTDVSVTHPSADSFAVRAASTALSAAARREQTKITKYGALARAEGALFHPFVMESFGAFGASCALVLNTLAAEAQANEICSSLEFRAGATRALSRALQIGNSRLVAVAIQRCASGGSVSVRRPALSLPLLSTPVLVPPPSLSVPSTPLSSISSSPSGLPAVAPTPAVVVLTHVSDAAQHAVPVTVLSQAPRPATRSSTRRGTPPSTSTTASSPSPPSSSLARSHARATTFVAIQPPLQPTAVNRASSVITTPLTPRPASAPSHPPSSSPISSAVDDPWSELSRRVVLRFSRRRHPPAASSAAPEPSSAAAPDPDTGI